MTTRLISVDSHVKVAPEQLRALMPSKYHDDWDGAVAAEHAQHVKEMGGVDPSVMAAGFSHEAFSNPGYYDPAERLKAMDRDGVEAEILYSEVSAFRHYPHMKEGWKEASEAFNRYMLDFASVDPTRFVPAYQVPLMDIDFAVKQVRGLAAEGAKAIHIPTFPAEVGLPEYHDSRYDPVWATISESGMSISQHLGLVESLWDLFRRDPTPQKAIFTSQPAMRLAETIAFWILPGVLARFPDLKIVLVEPSLGWVPFYLDLLDSMAEGPYDFPALEDKPSRLLPPPDVLDLRRRSPGTRAPPRAGRRSHHVVHGFSASGHLVAELATRRREELRGDPRNGERPHRGRQRSPRLPAVTTPDSYAANGTFARPRTLDEWNRSIPARSTS